METLVNKIKKFSNRDLKNIEELIQNMVQPESVSATIDNNGVVKIKYSKKKEHYLYNTIYHDSESIELTPNTTKYPGDYVFKMSSVSGTHSVTHCTGYGYAGCRNEDWVMTKERFMKYLDRHLDELYKYNDWK